MVSIERVSEQTGYLMLTVDGAVLTSSGELENDERIANIVTNLITLTDKLDPKAFSSHEGFDNISIVYDDHCYIICLSNKKVHVVKKNLIKDDSIMSTSNEQLIDI
ncbi:ragulator complex protein LAMTOR4 homolog [Copidosoma floridanum]|uniref:ragulator complex protein LAMTOR4 homolog n=1 Tax=Copidosoma floridanum TaxID=29053 RepID=UPI0006C9BE46|nr:ragulator complex protein LAMTOR4 homolog [Copidosoma floridanum]XP_014206772.1 ragulator complex protein LAMTOR4 homolog [Copidosoma floridanum]